MSFDMSLKNGIIISQTHFPIMNNKVIDDISFILIGMDIHMANISFHKYRTLLMYLILYNIFFFLPHLLIMFIGLDISCLFGELNLLFFV